MVLLDQERQKGREDRPQYDMKGEVCLLDVIQFSTMFYISAPSFTGLLLPAAGLRVG